MPVGLRNQDVEVIVVIQPSVKTGSAEDTPEARGWSAGFFEKTAGGWQGEALTRSPQGE